jgi:hypothetical protein
MVNTSRNRPWGFNRNRPLDFKGLIGMPEHANVEGVQRKTLLCEVALVQGLANLLAILYQ